MITFTGCELLADAQARFRTRTRPPARGKGHARSAASRRREVVVGGRRVKVIDVHAHCVIPEAYALLGLKVDDHRGPGIGEVGQRRIGEMDAQGIDMFATLVPPPADGISTPYRIVAAGGRSRLVWSVCQRSAGRWPLRCQIMPISG